MPVLVKTSVVVGIIVFFFERIDKKGFFYISSVLFGKW